MKLIGVRFYRFNLTFSRSFLYVLILINLFIIVKKFANFLDNFLKRKEKEMEKEYLTEEDAAKIKKELLKVLRSHDLYSGLAKAVLTDTIETIENYSQLPE